MSRRDSLVNNFGHDTIMRIEAGETLTFWSRAAESAVCRSRLDAHMAAIGRPVRISWNGDMLTVEAK